MKNKDVITYNYLDEMAECHRCDNKNSKLCQGCMNLSKTVHLKSPYRIYKPDYKRTIKKINLLEASRAVKELSTSDLEFFSKLKQICKSVSKAGLYSSSNDMIIKELNNYKVLITEAIDKYDLTAKEIKNMLDDKYYFIEGDYDRKTHMEVLSTIYLKVSKLIKNHIDPLKILEMKDAITYSIDDKSDNGAEIRVFVKREYIRNGNNNDVPAYYLDKIKDLLENHKCSTPCSNIEHVERNVFTTMKYNTKDVRRAFDSIEVEKISNNKILYHLVNHIKGISKDAEVIIKDNISNLQYGINIPETIKFRYVSKSNIDIDGNNVVANITIE